MISLQITWVEQHARSLIGCYTLYCVTCIARQIPERTLKWYTLVWNASQLQRLNWLKRPVFRLSNRAIAVQIDILVILNYGLCKINYF